MAPKVPRVWTRGAQNILATRDAALALTDINPGQTAERIIWSWMIAGTESESLVLDRFDGYYAGILIVPATTVPPANAAFAQRNTADWLAWEAGHMEITPRVSTPGQTFLQYPRELGYLRNVEGARTPTVLSTLWFCFARSGGSVLTDQIANVTFSVLKLGT